MNEIVFKIASSTEDLESVKEMRYKVFTIEQGIAHQLDDDGLDDSSIHILGDHQETGAPVVSGRLTINGSTGVISRIAVYKEYRGLKLGQEVVRRLEKVAIEMGVETLTLSPHAYLEKFYADLGYHTVSGEKKVGQYTLLTMKKNL
ncbi:MAG: GNAT family N-acetyltransferase [Cytophagales bacterium]|jgi:predicted GNAT family N-acyltransferase|nr:GNAT family N-acetyltransferase [Cytophagales bacterium]MCE2895631.1 GNAT family N-acetyltransferase [Flammeovirgaceae bacterium]MCA6368137.1 GNAT family N-acetyltransferase [Cytophagales bacterium]MCA6372052.1 GNAT family N-acetyltransferase [Cytophagales bacterium]MCA6375770.1 GNAT family N-acetyltransferase [Cytophagales bacterium]